MKKEEMLDKAMLVADKIQTNKYLMSVSNGLMATLPLLMVGSICMVINIFPLDVWKNFLTNIGISPILSLGSTLTTSMISLFAAFTIAYRFAELDGKKAVTGGLIGLLGFLIVTPIFNLKNEGIDFNGLTNVLPFTWLGAKGLFTAIIVALLGAKVYCVLVDKNITIKMPEGVPANVSSTFAGLLPTIIASAMFLVIHGIFNLTPWGSFADFIYDVISMPLNNLSDSVWSLCFIVLVQMLLWCFGLHGSIVVSSFINALYMPMDMINQEAAMAGAELPNILGKTFYSIYSGIGGAGGTLSLALLLFFAAKSKKHRMLGKLTLPPGLFTINEPLVFGLPLILNPVMAIPFIAVPLVQTLLAYMATLLHLVPRLNGVQITFGVPVLFNGFVAGGFRVVLLQIVLVLVGVVIYYPFFKVIEKRALEEEKAFEEKQITQG